MSHNDSPDNESVYNTPPEDLFPVFPQNNPPQDLFPVFQYDNSPQNTPPEFLFPPAINPPHYNPPANNPPHYNPPTNFPAQNQPNARALTDEELYEQDMHEVLRVEAEEEREAYLRAKQARRNCRCAWRIQNGLPRVPSSEDDSSASSHEGYVSDDSFS